MSDSEEKDLFSKIGNSPLINLVVFLGFLSIWLYEFAERKDGKIVVTFGDGIDTAALAVLTLALAYQIKEFSKMSSTFIDQKNELEKTAEAQNKLAVATKDLVEEQSKQNKLKEMELFFTNYEIQSKDNSEQQDSLVQLYNNIKATKEVDEASLRSLQSEVKVVVFKGVTKEQKIKELKKEIENHKLKLEFIDKRINLAGCEDFELDSIRETYLTFLKNPPTLEEDTQDKPDKKD